MIFIEILICLLIADFITGIGHWIEDTYGVLTWPWPLKEGIVIPNIEHHKNPTFLATMGTIFSRSWHIVIFLVPVGLMAIYFEYWQLGLILLFASLGNEVHAWNHRNKNNKVISILQDMCLIQTYYHHAKHHKAPYDKYFCTLTNWVNPVLELIRFWKILEWCIMKSFSIYPKRMTKLRDFV